MVWSGNPQPSFLQRTIQLMFWHALRSSVDVFLREQKAMSAQFDFLKRAVHSEALSQPLELIL